MRKLFAHTEEDSGKVVFATYTGKVRTPGVTPQEFVLRLDGSSKDDSVKYDVYMLGVPSNTDLMHGLFKSCFCKDLYVCSPALFPAEASSARQTVHMLRAQHEAHVPAALGGFHSLSNWSELVQYLIAQTIQRTSYGRPLTVGMTAEDQRNVLDLFMDHPLYRAVRLLEGVDTLLLVDLLSEIVDPRWHVALDDPDSVEPLFVFLGLADTNDPAAAYRADLIQHLWSDEGGHDAVGSFYRRGVTKASKAEEQRVVGRRLVYFLRQAWLASLYPEQANELFYPDLFSMRPLEVTRFRQLTSSTCE